MALEQIFARILEDAQIEAKDIIENASKEAGEIIQGLKREADQLKEKIIAEARAEGEFAFQKELTAKRLSAQKDLLRAKKSQLDNCFQEAQDVLLNLDDSLYRNLISNMLKKVNLKEETEAIFSLSDKSRINQDYLYKINPHLRFSFSDDIQGGFFLRTKDLIIDYSLSSILANLRQYLEPKLAEILFLGILK